MEHVVQSFFLSENALTFTTPGTKSVQILDDHTDDDVGFEEPEHLELALVAVSDSPQIVFDPAITNVNILDVKVITKFCNHDYYYVCYVIYTWLLQ